jgi:hypothetical protein
MTYYNFTTGDVEIRRITCIYERNGYADRIAYLHHLAEDFGLPRNYVIEMSNTLGSQDDFDGLVTTLSDVSHHVMLDPDMEDELYARYGE